MKHAIFLLSIILRFQDLLGYLHTHETPIAKHLTPIHITEEKSGLELIDCIYIINLDRRPEKWQKMAALFSEKGLHPNRVSAIDGWKIPIRVKKEVTGPYPVRLKPGHLGCLLSHLSVLKDAHTRGFNCIWVFEDDVEFKVDVEIIPDILHELNSLDPAWDIFYTDPDSFILSKSVDFRPDQPRSEGVSHYSQRRKLSQTIQTAGLRFGAYSVIFSKRGIEKVLNYFTHVYVWSNYDWDIHYIPGLREYSHQAQLVTVPYTNISDTNDYNPL